MLCFKWIIIVVNLLTLTLFGLSGISNVQGAFPGIFPLLTTNWYYKPSPTESVFLGLILVKVLALRLASATGILPIPYHLNDLFLRSFGKRSIMEVSINSNLTTTVLPITAKEFKTIERTLLSLRRIDSKDCFIRLVCEMNQDTLKGKHDHSMFLNVFRLRKKYHFKTNKENPIWEIYENVANPEVEKNCSKIFPNCPFSKKELEFDALLTGIF